MTKDSCSPQVEDGYIRIANELWNAICRTRILGEPRQVFDFIIRETYGFGKREDAISLSQFCLGTGLRRPNICRTIPRLDAAKLVAVIKGDNKKITKYRINKDYILQGKSLKRTVSNDPESNFRPAKSVKIQ